MTPLKLNCVYLYGNQKPKRYSYEKKSFTL